VVVTAAVVSLATIALDLAVLGSRWADDGTVTSAPAATTAFAPTTSASSAPATASTAALATTSTTTPAAPPTAKPTTSTTAPPVEAVLLAAGDIASCSSSGDEATASLLAARPSATVVTLGDNAYNRGTPAEFAGCFAPSWGAGKPRTRPSPGNHDYATAGAAGYFGYFGPAAGDATTGYYSYDLGAWHVVALNSNCWVVSCATGSAQERWLRADLAARRGGCTLAYWHHPRFSSGTVHGPTTAVAPLWQALYDYGAEVVLAGHEHNYERFAPLNPSGAVDPARGVRSFVVGTGGHSHYPFGPALPGSEVRNRDTFGVLQLTLKADAFSWQFLPEPGRTFTDSGTAVCH
jgi:hypothetical protein